MKTKLFLFVLLVNSCFLFSQDINLLKNTIFWNSGCNVSWEFSDSFVDINDLSNGSNRQKEKLNYIYENKGPYYHLKIKKGNDYTEYVSLLAPHYEFFLLYSINTEKPIEQGFFGKNSLLFMGKTKYNTRNYLTEGKIEYAPKNLSDISIGKPWVEGCPDSGIGERIYINHSSYIKSLIVSNGFVSFKISTYYNNNRVKLLRVYNSGNKNEFFNVELPDNAIPFEIILPFNTKIVELEILDIYKGEKYDDTCINFILCKSDY